MVQIYAFSRASKKIAYSLLHNGVCHAMLVDKGSQGDSVMNQWLTIVENDSDSDE